MLPDGAPVDEVSCDGCVAVKQSGTSDVEHTRFLRQIMSVPPPPPQKKKCSVRPPEGFDKLRFAALTLQVFFQRDDETLDQIQWIPRETHGPRREIRSCTRDCQAMQPTTGGHPWASHRRRWLAYVASKAGCLQKVNFRAIKTMWAWRTHLKPTAHNNPNRRQRYSWDNSTEMTWQIETFSTRLRIQETGDKLLQPPSSRGSDLSHTNTRALAGATFEWMREISPRCRCVTVAAERRPAPHGPCW